MNIQAPSLNEHHKNRLQLYDLIWMFLAPFVALAIRWPEFINYFGYSQDYVSSGYEYAIVTFVTSVPIFLLFRAHEFSHQYFSARDIVSLVNASLCSVAVSIAMVFALTRLDGIPRTVPIIYGVALIFGLVIIRIVLRSQSEKYITSHPSSKISLPPDNIRRVIIIGLDDFSRSAIRLIDNQKPRTTHVVAALTQNAIISHRLRKNIKIYDNIGVLESLLNEYTVHGIRINEIWISDFLYPLSSDLLHFINTQSQNQDITCKSLSAAFNLTGLSAVDTEDFLRSAKDIKPLHNGYFKYKRIIDLFLAIPVVLFLIFLIPILSLVTLFSLGAPIFFWQQRTGWLGQQFQLYKFRTLGPPFDQRGNILSDDERSTTLSSFIRKTRLDELPQLLSVIAGDMSFIGPRPLLPRDEPVDNQYRLMIRPGITGWAQVHGNNLLSPDERNALDCWYVDHASFYIDMKIIFKTIHLIIFGVKRNEKVLAELELKSLTKGG